MAFHIKLGVVVVTDAPPIGFCGVGLAGGRRNDEVLGDAPTVAMNKAAESTKVFSSFMIFALS